MVTSTGANAASDEADLEQRQTLWVGGLNEKVTEEILYELFQNAGPLMSVRLPVDKDSKRQKTFAFVRFHHEESVPYAVDMFRDVRLFGQNLRMQNRTTGAGMSANNRYQQPAPMDQGNNGHQQQQRGVPPPLPPQIWQNQIEPVFQNQNQALGHQIVPFQSGFQQAPMFVPGNRIGYPQQSEADGCVPNRYDPHQQQQHHHQQQQQHQQQRRDHDLRHEMRHGRDEQRQGSHHSHHHRSQSERSRGFDRNQHDQHRDRSYDNRRRR